MKTKLTLSLDEDLIAFARQQARREGTSISGLLADFLTQRKLRVLENATPAVGAMVGSLKRYAIDDSKMAIREAYGRKHLN